MAGKSKVDLTAVGSRIKKLRGTMLQEELATHLNVAKDTSQRLNEERLHPVWRCSFCCPKDSTRPSTGYSGAK